MEPYVTLSPDGEDELVVSLDVGSSAVLTYPFSRPFLVETLNTWKASESMGRGSMTYWLYDYPAEGRRWQRFHHADCPHVARRSETDKRVTWTEVDDVPPGAFGCSTCGATGAGSNPTTAPSQPDVHPLAGQRVRATVLVDEEDVEPWTMAGVLNLRWIESLKYTQYTVSGHPVKPETIEKVE